MMNDFWAEPDPDEDPNEWEDDEEEYVEGIPAGTYSMDNFWEEISMLQKVEYLKSDFSDLEDGGEKDAEGDSDSQSDKPEVS